MRSGPPAGAATGYVYDAEGRRVAKGTWASGTVPNCSTPTAANGFTLTAVYLRDASGGQDVEIDPAVGSFPATWHQNVFADGSLFATYTDQIGSAPALSFNFNDWLGTKRLEVNAAGQATNYWGSDPFGNYLTAHVSGSDPTEQHFTGTERDNESGLDLMGARYYNSSMGRFTRPDPSGLAYADFTNPQSLNLYAYALNNPLRFTDPSGLTICDWGSSDTHPGNDYDDDDDCVADGGKLVEDRTTVTVTATPTGQNVDTQETTVTDGVGFIYNFGGYTGPMTVSNLRAGFYRNKEKKYNACLAQLFGGHAPPPQSSANAPRIDATKSSAALGAMYGIANANGENNPNLGPNGTIYFANNAWNTGASNQVNANYGTLAHEGANMLNFKQNGSESTYGDPTQQYGQYLPNGDPQDPDTGAATERCMFGRLQYP